MSEESDNVFDKKFNPWTGKFDYDFQPEEVDSHQATARSSFGDMLHDWDRNRKYERALKSAIDEMHQNGKQANVLDIGMGTGLLSMMAVRNGADSVTSCECFEPIYVTALKVIERNGFADKIKPIFKSSHLLTVGPGCDLEKRANILVAELFDTELIGENALYFFKHAIENLLEKDSIVIPQYATIYAQVVECSIAQDWHKIWDIYDDEGKLLLKVPNEVKNCPGPNVVHDLQLSQLKPQSFNTIIPPVHAYRFDFSGKTPVEIEGFRSTIVKAKRSGRAQVIFMWWELQMDTNAEVILSCAPSWVHPETDNYPWRDHWMQAIYHIPQERQLEQDEQIQLVCAQDGLSFIFKLIDLDKKACFSDFSDSPHCYCELHSMSRTKVGQMNWAMKNKKYIPILKKYISKDSTVLMLSEGYFLGLVAAMLGVKTVYCIGGDFCNRTSQTLSQFTTLNGIDNLELFKNFDHFQTSCNELKNIDVIFGEPYFVESVLPWDNLRFAHLVKSMKHRLKSDVKIVPQSATIKCVAVNFDDLHKIRVPVNECEGFTMEDFEELIMHSSSISDEVVEPQPLWEYPGCAVSTTQEIVTVDLVDNSLDDIEKKGVLEIDQGCNGIAFWIDWKHEKDSTKVMSTGPIVEPNVGEVIQWNMHYKQGVSLFPTKNVLSLNYEFKFNFNNGNVSFHCD